MNKISHLSCFFLPNQSLTCILAFSPASTTTTVNLKKKKSIALLLVFSSSTHHCKSLPVLTLKCISIHFDFAVHISRARPLNQSSLNVPFPNQACVLCSCAKKALEKSSLQTLLQLWCQWTLWPPLGAFAHTIWGTNRRFNIHTYTFWGLWHLQKEGGILRHYHTAQIIFFSTFLL